MQLEFLKSFISNALFTGLSLIKGPNILIDVASIVVAYRLYLNYFTIGLT
jgi:hypothetical protein